MNFFYKKIVAALLLSFCFSLVFAQAPPDPEKLLLLDDIVCGQTVVGTTVGASSLFHKQLHKQRNSPCAVRPDVRSTAIDYLSDAAYRLELDSPTSIRFKLANNTQGTDFDLFLYGTRIDIKGRIAIDIRACMGASATISGDVGPVEEFEADLEAGTYYVVVDGARSGDVGDFELTLECGFRNISCGQELAGNTIGKDREFSTSSHYGACLGNTVVNTYEASEELFRFELQEATTVLLKLKNESGKNLDMFLLESEYVVGDNEIIPVPGNCLLAGTQPDSAANEELVIDLAPGFYWVVVDGDLLPGFPVDIEVNEGPFLLSLTCFELPTPCDLESNFIQAGSIIQNFFDDGDDVLAVIPPQETPRRKALSFISCISEVYGNTVPNYAKAYTYYHDGIASSFTISVPESGPGVSAFVFSCEADDRSSSCLGVTDQASGPLVISGVEEGYYQVLLVSNQLNSFTLSVDDPVGPCFGEGITFLAPGVFIDTTVTGLGNDFDPSLDDRFGNCYFGNRSFAGEDMVFALEIDRPEDLELGSLVFESDEELGVFVFNYLCGEGCLSGFDVFPDSSLVLELKSVFQEPGIYYVFVDQADPTGDGAFTVNYRTAQEYVIKSRELNACALAGAQEHVIRFDDGILRDIKPTDKVRVDFPEESKIEGEYTYSLLPRPLEVSGNTFKPFTIYAQSPEALEDGKRCGLEVGEKFVIELEDENGDEIELMAVWDPEFAQDTFAGSGAVSRVRTLSRSGVARLKVFRFVPDISLEDLRSERAEIGANINVNPGEQWRITKLDPSQEWYSFSVDRGRGKSRITITVEESLESDLRTAEFVLRTSRGRDVIMISQKTDACFSSRFRIDGIRTTPVLCKGDDNGTAEVFLAGGNPEYSYLWSNGNTTARVEDLSGGTYTVEVQDANGCRAIEEIRIPEPDNSLQVEITIEEPVRCEGSSTGRLLATGTEGYGNYQYAWEGGDFSEDGSLDGVGAGTYTVQVKDVVGCTETAEFTLPGPDNPLRIESIVQTVLPSCPGDSDGEVVVTIEGGTPDFSVIGLDEAQICDVSAVDAEGQTSITLCALAAADYTIVILDGDNCAVSGSFSVEDPAGMVLSITTTEVSCFGFTDGTATVDVVSGGSPGFSYQWSVPGDEERVGGLAAEPVQVTVTDGNGCEETAEATPGGPAAELSVDFNVLSEVTCEDPFSGGLLAMPEGGWPGNYSIFWSEPVNAFSPAATGLYAGTFSVLVTDSRGCTATSEFTMNGPANAPVIELDAVQNDQSSEEEEGNGSIDVTVTGGAGDYVFEWTLDGEVFSTDEDLAGLVAGEYVLKVTDSENCMSALVVSVTSESGTSIRPIIGVQNHKAKEEAEHLIRVYPNPASDQLFVQYSGKSDLTAELWSLTGQKLRSLQWSDGPSTYAVDLVELPQGSYILNLVSGDFVTTKKILIQ